MAPRTRARAARRTPPDEPVSRPISIRRTCVSPDFHLRVIFWAASPPPMASFSSTLVSSSPTSSTRSKPSSSASSSRWTNLNSHEKVHQNENLLTRMQQQHDAKKHDTFEKAGNALSERSSIFCFESPTVVHSSLKPSMRSNVSR